jgi:hypothetical protein
MTPDDGQIKVESSDCLFAGHPFGWVTDALEGWRRVNEAHLMISRLSAPLIVVFDTHCRFTLHPRGSGTERGSFQAGGFEFEVTSASHQGEIVLPDGKSVHAQLVSFAGSLPDGGIYFVMSLPEIWATSAQASNTEMLASVVFVHEFTHTQSGELGDMVDALILRGLPEDTDDDVIQTRFEDRPGFADAYREERDLLYAAYSAEDQETMLDFAHRAMSAIDSRRARYFTGSEALYAEAEDIFLTMEGTGQFAAYQWLVDPLGGGLQPSEALDFVRRDGGVWSQDEGLALFLVLQRLSADWPRDTFGPESETVLVSLRKALNRELD